jgi:hypothetical protein
MSSAPPMSEGQEETLTIQALDILDKWASPAPTPTFPRDCVVMCQESDDCLCLKVFFYLPVDGQVSSDA